MTPPTDPPLPTLDAIARHLADRLDAAEFGEEAGGVVVPRDAPVRRIALLLDPLPELPARVARERTDALLLHRHWRLDPAALPGGTGVLAFHRPFDERLTLGWNPRLAGALGIERPEPLGRKEGRVIGMCGDVAPDTFRGWTRRLEEVFGGVEAATPPADGRAVSRVAVMGAMTEALVEGAAERGVGLYVTGQLRVPAREAVRRTGIGVVAVGHHRSEWWGMRALAGMLRERWAGVEVAVWAEDEAG